MNRNLFNLYQYDRTLFTSPTWLIFLMIALVLTFGVSIGYGVTRLHFAIPIGIVIAIPLSIMWVRQPFTAVICWLLVAPFFVVTLSGPIRIVYWFTHRTIIPLALIIAMLNGAARKRILRVGWIDFFLLAYILINVFSILFYFQDPEPELIHVYDWILVGTVLFWLIRMTAPGERQLRQMMIAIIIMCLIQGVVGVMMNISVTRPLLPEYWIVSQRTTGTLKRVDEYGSTVIASLLLILHYLFHTRRQWIRILGIVTIGVGSLGLAFSFSRSTWLAGTIVLIVVIILYRRLVPYILAIALIIAPLAMTAGIFSNAREFASQRFQTQHTIDVRIISYYAALRMISIKPLLGWGYGNFTRYHLDFVKPTDDTPVTNPYLSSHNTYLGTWVELGLVGLIALIMPGLLLLKRSLSRYNQLPQEGFYSRYLLLMLWLGVVAWFVSSNFINMLLTTWGNTWVRFLLGLIASMVYANEESPSKPEIS